MFWACAGNSVDNSSILFLIEQCLHSIKALSASHLTTREDAGGVQVFGGDRARTSDSDGPKGYPRPKCLMHSIKKKGEEEKKEEMFEVMTFVLPSDH